MATTAGKEQTIMTPTILYCLHMLGMFYAWHLGLALPLFPC